MFNLWKFNSLLLRRAFSFESYGKLFEMCMIMCVHVFNMLNFSIDRVHSKEDPVEGPVPNPEADLKTGIDPFNRYIYNGDLSKWLDNITYQLCYNVTPKYGLKMILMKNTFYCTTCFLSRCHIFLENCEKQFLKFRFTLHKNLHV